jgi:drug/metabolite transporter (DMT)-like permease
MKKPTYKGSLIFGGIMIALGLFLLVTHLSEFRLIVRDHPGVGVFVIGLVGLTVGYYTVMNAMTLRSREREMNKQTEHNQKMHAISLARKA